MLTESDMRNILRHRCEAAGGMTKWAREHNLNPGYVSSVLAGQRTVGPKIAAAIGYKSAAVFFPLQSANGDVR